MEQNLFTEGVRPGSVTTPEEVHMLICYIFREAGQPVTLDQASPTRRYLQTAACQCCFLTLTYLSTGPMSKALETHSSTSEAVPTRG